MIDRRVAAMVMMLPGQTESLANTPWREPISALLDIL